MVAFFIVFQVLLSTGNLSGSFTGQLIPICAYVVMALSLNLVVGISGELSLGHAGFMSVGAFTGVIVATSLKNVVAVGPVRLALAILIGALLAAIVGLLIGIPVLRLQGDYLAIVTLAFGEIIKNILNCLYIGVDAKGLHFSMTDPTIGMGGQGTIILNGPMGAVGIRSCPPLSAASFWCSSCCSSSKPGQQPFRPGHQGHPGQPHRRRGLRPEHHQIQADGLCHLCRHGWAASALYALNYSSIVPKKFDFNTSILILVFVVLGGIGNLRGSIIAAAVLTVLPELLRQFQDYRMLIYAIVLILVMLITNNPQARALLHRIGAKFRGKSDTEEEGAIHE